MTDHRLLEAVAIAEQLRDAALLHAAVEAVSSGFSGMSILGLSGGPADPAVEKALADAAAAERLVNLLVELEREAWVGSLGAA